MIQTLADKAIVDCRYCGNLSLESYGRHLVSVFAHLPHVSISFYDGTNQRVSNDACYDERGRHRCYGNIS